PGSETLVSMGSRIRHDFGDQAFIIAFSAAAGKYRLTRQPERILDAAPDSTLEGRAFVASRDDVRYLGAAELRSLQRVSARPLGAAFKTAVWSDVFDGLVVYRVERPPTL